MMQSGHDRSDGPMRSAIQEASSVLVERLLSDEASITNLDESAMESRPSAAHHEQSQTSMLGLVVRP